MPLSAGVLIIGSLFWDSEQNRPAWRDARLNMATAQTYTYTMVFSRLAKPGQAKVVQCRHAISTAADLVAEAQALWKAEQPTAAAGRIAADWGCVALLHNPERKIPEEILKGWEKRVADEPGYGNVPQTEAEGSLVSREGLLQIAWPRPLEGGIAVQLDILLVTANAPTLNGKPLCYPSAATVARAWNMAGPVCTK